MNDVQVFGGVPPPPPSDPVSVPTVCPSPGVSMALAPPPGFSDSDHSMSDTDSLGSEPGQFNRFGFSRVSKPRGDMMGFRQMPQV